MRLEVTEVLRDKKRMIDSLSEFTGRSTDLLVKDFKRDFYLTADEAFEYGLIDRVLRPKKSDVLLGGGE
jgi:ATP-dependent Clp protease protease subunit